MRGLSLAAVDLGASSGRVMLGHVADGRVSVTEASRFANVPVRAGGTLHWDVLALHRGMLDGLRAAGRRAGRLDGIGIDSWAVDYGLLDADGVLLGNPVHYRDARTAGVPDRVMQRIPAEQIYRTTGLQQLPFNTIYQLAAAAGTEQLAAARTLLMIPDLLTYWLTGRVGAEVTNASTTQLYDVTARTWSVPLIEATGASPQLFAPLCSPGDDAGALLPDVLADTGLAPDVRVRAVGSHDTASAVVAVPAAGPRFAYVSCGTWSLVGVELERPILTEASRLANFTNETGVDGTIRYLRNVMGLWLLQESMRTWQANGQGPELEALLRRAAEVPAFRSVVAVDDPAFLPPGDMPARIRAACARSGQPVPTSQAETTRCVLDSLALAYRAALDDARTLSGHDVDVVHLVGGGARNALLCQLTADACGVPVVAGPVEAAALGNVLVQARAAGAVGGGLDAMRAVVRGSEQLVTYRPVGDERAWRAAAARIGV